MFDYNFLIDRSYKLLDSKIKNQISVKKFLKENKVSI